MSDSESRFAALNKKPQDILPNSTSSKKDDDVSGGRYSLQTKIVKGGVEKVLPSVPLNLDSNMTSVRQDSIPQVGKSRDPRYKRVMILVQINTEKRASRKWEDEHPGNDFSDLVQLLLNKYAEGEIDPFRPSHAKSSFTDS